MSVLTQEDLPQPRVESAFLDNNGKIWLWMSYKPSTLGIWRLPGGTLAMPKTNVLKSYIEKNNVTQLRKMVPVRRR